MDAGSDFRGSLLEDLGSFFLVRCSRADADRDTVTIVLQPNEGGTWSPVKAPVLLLLTDVDAFFVCHSRVPFARLRFALESKGEPESHPPSQSAGPSRAPLKSRVVSLVALSPAASQLQVSNGASFHIDLYQVSVYEGSGICVKIFLRTLRIVGVCTAPFYNDKKTNE
jgi:hypothetical protein